MSKDLSSSSEKNSGAKIYTSETEDKYLFVFAEFYVDVDL